MSTSRSEGIDWDRKARQVRESTIEELHNLRERIPQAKASGADWKGPQNDEWRDGEHWSWLFGASPWAQDGGKR